MSLTMKKLVIGLLCLLTFPLWAQTGSYFLSHHAPTEKSFDNLCFDMAQDQNGVMYFAVKAGILGFDGREWELIPGAGAVYSIDRNEAGEVFWSGAKGFGKIGFDGKGFKQIQYLSDSSAHDVFQTLANKSDIYFLSQNTIYLYNGVSAKTQVVAKSDGQNLFSGIFELFGVVYVQTERNTTFKIENGALVYVNLDIGANVIFNSRIEDTYLLGTSDNRIYTCKEDLVMRPVLLKDQPYANANVVVNGTWVNEDLLALGTLRGGVMLINPETGKRDQIINYATGLPDNEVFTLMADRNQNIWVAHEYGFTQISPAMPFRSFSHYPGLEGNMLCAYSYGGNVYVGTSVGLFKLDKEEIYDEVVSFGNPEVAGNAAGAKGQHQFASDTGQPEAQEETPSKRRGIFSFLRRHRKKETASEPPVSDEQTAGNHSVATKEGQGQTPERKVEKVLRSSQFVFKKVDGIGAKITHLVEAEGKLIAGGLEGVFEIDGLRSTAILNLPTRYLYASADKATVIASTYNDEIWSLKSQGSHWSERDLINSLGDQIDFIFEGSENEWWLCGLDRIYQLRVDSTGIERLKTIPLFNGNLEKTVGLFYHNQTIFVNMDGFYRFERPSGTLARIDTLPRPLQYFAINGHILYRDEHRWHLFGTADERNNLQLLNLFQNLRFITTDHDPRNLWLISGSNELLKFHGDDRRLVRNQFPIFLKSIHNNSVTLANFSHITLDQLYSAVTFEVVQPDFINAKSIEYRYLLKGMSPNWSEWSSSNNKINFPYLPPGEYNLEVQARNIFGKISTLQPLAFEVIPPYWRRWWFYGLEFSVFASLVILSFRLSTRYRFVSRLLSLITIILLIEFIQTVIGASITADTPVVAFFIQFVVAMMILPVEGFLRNLMLRSLDRSVKRDVVVDPGEVKIRKRKGAGKRAKEGEKAPG